MHSSSAAHDSADPGIVWVETPQGLRAIGHDAVRLVVWKNAVPADLRRSLPSGARDLPQGRFCLPANDARGALDRAFDGRWLALATALAGLAEAAAAALSAPALELRLERVRHDSCRLFHVDYVPARLIATLIGPGTEYLPEPAVRREGLGKGDNRRICRDWRALRRVPPGAAGLFKGAIAEAGPRLGAVHRSPPIAHEGETRYLAVIEAQRPISCA
jgi:hypothetical protein